MNTDCAHRDDALLEAALTGIVDAALAAHLPRCARCTQQLAALQLRRQRLDALLALDAQRTQPPADLRVRVAHAVAAADAARRGPRRSWVMATATALTVAGLAVSLSVHRSAGRAERAADLAGPPVLAEWRAPTDALLVVPGQNFLRAAPKLGESYLRVPARTDEED